MSSWWRILKYGLACEGSNPSNSTLTLKNNFMEEIELDRLIQIKKELRQRIN